ncbi:lysosomal-trafficking regulator [Microplitis mediator]|uniref:lysosomal-trafficking regulator n=1 Tax=Microplitis mediator TaxID=375433 RepID=UPI0025522EF8|nr:lysosomal-trafficking regulator [Microplitis mediator]
MTSPGCNDKLQLLWDNFIHAEPMSYQKSSWLDRFLAELLAQVNDGIDINNIISSWCSFGGNGDDGGICTLIACELLSDINELCTTTKNEGGDELVELRKYLIQGRGWRCLTVIDLLGGIRDLSCGRQLVALLIALYPVVASHHDKNNGDVAEEENNLEINVTCNPYVKLNFNDETIDKLDIISQMKKKNYQRRFNHYHNHNNSHNVNNDPETSRKKLKKHSPMVNVKRRELRAAKVNKSDNVKTETNYSDSSSYESDYVHADDDIDQTRSLMFKIRLNPMDFDYFTHVVRSDGKIDEEDDDDDDDNDDKKDTVVGIKKKLNQSNYKNKKIEKYCDDDRVKAVLNIKISNFEISLLIIQLLQSMKKDYDNTSVDQTVAIKIVKFALDTLWSLQFGADADNLTGIECVRLKAATSRLMLTALERVLTVDDQLMTAVINNGLLPMTLRLLEDNCSSKLTASASLEEGSLLQECIFAMIYGTLSFLYYFVNNRKKNLDKLNDFLELFQLFIESQDGKLIEKTIVTILDLPSIDSSRSMTRALKVIDMIGVLINGLKHIKQELSYTGSQSKISNHPSSNIKLKHKHLTAIDSIKSYHRHHHNDVLGIAYYQPTMVASISHQTCNCSISSLFIILIRLLKESSRFDCEFQVRLLKIMKNSGTCCCFPLKILLINIINYVKKQPHNKHVYSSCIALLERCLFKESNNLSTVASEDNHQRADCNICTSKSSDYSWDFIELYGSLLSPENYHLCCMTMTHLVKVTPHLDLKVKHEMLSKIFYPTFLKAKIDYRNLIVNNKSTITVEFIIQSCLSIISSLIVDNSLYEKFMQLSGLDEALELLSIGTFTRSVCNLLQISVIMEIWKTIKLDINPQNSARSTECSPLKLLFEIIEHETNSVLCDIENIETFKQQRCSKKIFEKSNSDIILNDDYEINRENKTDDTEELNSLDKNDESLTINLFKASAVWRSAAGVALYCPKFRQEFSSHLAIVESSLNLTKILVVSIVEDRILDQNKWAHKLIEALITCHLTSALYNNSDIISVLKKTLINAGIKFGRGIAVLVEIFLKIAMLKPCREQVPLQSGQLRLPAMISDCSSSAPDYGGDESSAGEYVTADDGYEADNEVPSKSSRDEDNSQQNNLPKGLNSLDSTVESRGGHITANTTAHPALCSLAVDLLIQFGQQGLDTERCIIVSQGLRKVAVTCRESVSNCAALAGSGVIAKLLNGFREILISKNSQYEDLQQAILQVFTLLATQSISPNELLLYFSLFKVNSPPMLSLLQPLHRLVINLQPQPNFILSFPLISTFNEQKQNTRVKEECKNIEKVSNTVHNYREKHLSAGVYSPWSVHATCLPIGSELSWSVWLHGCSASMWIRVERGVVLGSRLTTAKTSPVNLFNSESDSLSEWGPTILSDNNFWSREISAESISPPPPLTTIVHLMSIGFESLILETWLDLRSDKLIVRLSRPDDKCNNVISETSISGILPSGRWHHLALNFKDTVLNRKSAVVQVTIWVDGWREANVELPFDGLLVRKPATTTCVMLGQSAVVTSGNGNSGGAWYLGNLMLFRCPVFTKERALYLTSLGPNYTNIADCILNSVKPDFASLIASGAINGVRQVKFKSGKFDLNRRKSYGGTYLRRVVETKIVSVDSEIDWNAVMNDTTHSSQLSELQDNILLSYEAKCPNTVNLYPQAITNPSAVVRNLLPGQPPPGFRVVSAPEHRVSQQPPLSITVITPTHHLERQQYRGFISSASLIGGIPIFLYLFARIVELDSSEEEQALALSIVVNLARSDSELLSQYNSEGGQSLIMRVLESPRCYAGKYLLKAILDSACSSSIIVKDIANGNNLTILQSSEAVIVDPELIKESLGVWKTWVKHDTFNMFLHALLVLLRDQHAQREFNATQLNRVEIVEMILFVCKQHFMYEDFDALWDTTTGNSIVELIRALMGAPPEFSHLVAIMDYLILVHQASDTYVTHSRHNMYFLLPPLIVEEAHNDSKLKSPVLNRLPKTASTTTASSSDESNTPALEVTKLNKALINVQLQRDRAIKRREKRSNNNNNNCNNARETSAGEDSGIAASDGSNNHLGNENCSSGRTDEKRVCQGLVTEGLLLLLRDALRVLPDCHIESVVKHVIRAELLLILLNNPDTRVRTAVIKVIQTYLQRADDEEINKFIKQKYFFHLANQITLYPSNNNESLSSSLECLALRGPTTLAAIPPLLAMLTRIPITGSNITRPIINLIIDMINKNPSSLRTLLSDQGLAESLAQSLVGGAHNSASSGASSPPLLINDIHILLVSIATKLLEQPGSHHMPAISDLHLILNYVEFNERSQCGANAACVSVIRNAQVVLFDGELDVLMPKVSSLQSGFKLRSATSYLASSSYLAHNNVLTTSSEQSDHESRTSSYGGGGSASGINLYGTTNREPRRGEVNERFRSILFKAIEFLTASDCAPSNNELELTKRIYIILLYGMSNSSFDRKNNWSGSWSVRSILRKNAAKMIIWLLSPHQSNSTRVFAIRSLMEESRGREILSSILEINSSVEKKLELFLWDLFEKRTDMPSSDARLCTEFKETLAVWHPALLSIEGTSTSSDKLRIEDQLASLRLEFSKDREIWLDNNLSALHRIGNKFDLLAKQLTESAMIITRSVIEEQNHERKALMEKFKHTRGLEAQSMARWRDLTKRLTHERAPWYFPESYPTNWELDPTEGPARVRIRMQRCHLKINKKFFLTEQQTDPRKVASGNDQSTEEELEQPLSYLFTNMRRQDLNATALIERLHTSERIGKMSQVKVVTPQIEIPGEALIGETCLYFVPDNPEMSVYSQDTALLGGGCSGLDLAMAGGTAWKLKDIRELHRRRYQLQERAIEFFLTTGRTLLLAFNSSKERDEFVSQLLNCNLPQRVPGDDLNEALAAWRNGYLTNWEYITCLNKLAGRSYNDLMQYPVFPFVLADYTSSKIDLTNPNIYRNFKRPMAVQDKKNEQHYVNNYNYLKQALAEGLNLIALNQEPFHYGSHYSNSGTVLHFLVRLPPFTSMFLSYQDNNFDIPDRTFHALATTWRLTSCDSTTDVKELIPEFFYLPEFLLNSENFNFGVRQNGCRVGDVELPSWCNNDARLFVLVHRAALESDIVRENMSYWIDLVFGFRQTGRPAVEAINVFHPATYYGFNVDKISDPVERKAWETMVKTYGQTPAQLFTAAHPLPCNVLMNSSNSPAYNTIPPVIEGVTGIKWGYYVGAPGNEPVLCWKHKHRVPMVSLIPLTTGDVFGLPACTALLIGYNNEKGGNMVNSTTVLGAALASWDNNDGIIRLKSKKEQPPKPLMKSSGFDPITVLGSAADCGQLWIGYMSGKIMVYSYSIEASGKIKFESPTAPASVLLAHRCAITVIVLSGAFSIAVSGDVKGVIVIWDLNSLSYVRSIVCHDIYTINNISISDTLGDIAVVCQLVAPKRQFTSPTSSANENNFDHQSQLKVFTINAKSVGSVLSRRRITALCYSNAPEGVSVNVIATGLDNGVIRLWSSWDLRLIREIVNGGTDCGAIIAIAWAYDQHHLYAATENSTVLIWEGLRRLNSGTPKFVNLTSL